MGQTTRTAGVPLFKISARNQNPCQDEDGCVSDDARLMGTYIHGMFDNPAILRFWLKHIGLNNIDVSSIGGIEARDKEYDLLAEHFETHINVEGIVKLIANQE